MRKTLLVTLCCATSFLQIADAQCKDNAAQPKHTLQPVLDFDQRFSFIKNTPVNIWGYRVGVMVNQKYKIGIGGYFLNDKVDSKRTDTFNQHYFTYNRKLYFITGYYEPYLIRRRYWESSILAEIGFGKNEENLLHTTDNYQLKSPNKYFIPAGLGLSINLKCPVIYGITPTSWFGLNFLLGYRKSLFAKELKTPYNGMFWSVGAAVFLDKALVDINHWLIKKPIKKQYN